MLQFLLVGLMGLAAAPETATAPPSIFNSRPAGVPDAIIGSNPPAESPETPPVDAEADPMEAAIEKMSLQQKIAQLMVVTMQGSHTPTVADLSYLKAYTPGGAIIPKILKPSYAAIYVAKIRGVEQLSGVPIWIGTNIYRLTHADREEFSQFIQLPSPLSLAAANDEATTRALAELLAQHLSLMGFDLHLGPSLDLAPTLTTAEGSVYSLGSDPAFIGTTFGVIREVFKQNGILTVPLGFPGGGFNRPAKSSAVLLTPAATLKQTDLAPFMHAVANECPVIHVGSTLVPTLDPLSPPACVSKPVLRGLLREELAYEGIVLAGPMDSQDVAGLIDPAEAAIRALGYGADMILWNGAGSSEMRAVDNIALAITENRLPMERIDTALRRVLTYKFANKAAAQAAVKERQAAPLEKQRQLARRVQAIERQAITVVQNRDNILPLRKENAMPIGVTGTVGVETLTKALEEHIKPISQQPITTARHIGEIKNFEISRITSHIRGIRTVVCVFTDTDRPGGQVELIKALQAKGARVVVILLGYPRNLPYLAIADAVVLAYCDTARYNETVAAMGDILVGQGPVGFATIPADIEVHTGEARTFNASDLVRVPTGHLPVTLSEKFPVGFSVAYDPQYAIKKVAWDFGDGTKSKDHTAVHAFKSPGRYPVSLSVTSEDGDTSNYTFHVLANGVQ